MAKIVFDSEKELEDYIFNKIEDSEGGLCPIDNEHHDAVFRQLKIGNYGITDIVKFQANYWDDNGCSKFGLVITVLEIKKEALDYKSVIQVMKYLAGIEHSVRRIESDFSIHVQAQLVAPEIKSSTDFVFLLNHIPNLEVYTVNCSLDGGFETRQYDKSWSMTHPCSDDFELQIMEFCEGNELNFKKWMKEEDSSKLTIVGKDDV